MQITKETVQYFKNNKHLITEELLEELRKTNEGKEIALEMLDTEKDDELYYLDAFDNRISFNGNRQLKKAFTKLNLSDIHVKEIQKCSESLQYFRNNYVKIKTHKGISFPDMRPYQDRFLNEIEKDNEAYVVLFPRQCICKDTLITVNGIELPISYVFELCEYRFGRKVNCGEKYTVSWTGGGRKILTPLGYRNIEFIHKTIPFRKYHLEFDNGKELDCAENHVLIDINNNEIHAKDSLGTSIKTVFGSTKVVKCIDCQVEEEMYDISIQKDTELYFTNGVLSHNSGKSITTAIYLAWQFIFGHDFNIGICANKGNMAREFLNNVKNIFTLLPIWMQQGIKVWNKGGIEAENGMRILTDVPSSNSFRGFSCALLVVDECAYIPTTKWNEFIDGIMPSQSSFAWKKNILLSTANGMNHFYQIVAGARKRKVLNEINETEFLNLNKDEILESNKNLDGTYDVTLNKSSNGYDLIEVDWREVPRYDSNGNTIDPEKFKEQIIEKYGLVYFNQCYASEFIGSSHTLINSDALSQLSGIDLELKKDGLLKVYENPRKNHKYIMAIDPAKDGIDGFCVQIIDITKFPFKQVASCNLQIDYFKMPEFLNEWGKYYNTAFMIIENNEGAGQSVADMLWNDYEYENLFFDKVVSNLTVEKRKKYPGFRTTSKSRKLILDTLKLFIENKQLIINDSDTINQFYTFVLINGKYQAEDGYHDDLIMSLALAFAPFMNLKNFNDMKQMIKSFYSNDTITSEFTDHLNIGFFDY